MERVNLKEKRTKKTTKKKEKIDLDMFEVFKGITLNFSIPLIREFKEEAEKESKKGIIIKNIIGNTNIRHAPCNKLYDDDDCKYCTLCEQTQEELANKIIKELGLEND